MRRLGIVIALVGCLIAAQPASAHRPNRGVAAGHFAMATAEMCDNHRCSWYGRARCWRVNLRHSVACQRDSVLRETINHWHYVVVYRMTGTVDHSYRPHNLRCYLLGVFTA